MFPITCLSQSPDELSMEVLDIYLEKHGLSGKETLYEDHKGFIWACTSQGVYRWDGKEWSHIHLFTNNARNFQEVKDIIYRPNIGYIFSCFDNGLLYYSPTTDKKTHITSVEYKGEVINVSAASAYNRNGYRVIVAALEGAFTFDAKGGLMSHEKPTDDNPESNHTGHHKNGLKRVIMYHPINDYYYGGNNGLYSRHVKDDRCIDHPMPYENDYHRCEIRNFQIQYLILNEEKIYATTWGNGIMIFDIKTKSWDRRRELKWPDHSVTFNMLNTHGDNWLVTRYSGETGIGLFNEKYGHIHDVYDMNGDRLFNTDAIIKDSNGKIWTSSNWRIATLRYPIIPLVNNPKGIYIKSVSIDDKEQSTFLDFWDSKSISMLPTEKTIDLSFRIINPLSYDSITYEYRMEGLHDEWRSNGNNEDLSYDLVNSGEYSFQVRFFNQEQQKYIYSGQLLISKSVIDLNNRLTQLILGLGILAVIIIFSLLYYIYNQKRIKRKEKEFQHKLLEVQTMALRSQMNPHFLFNCLNSIRYFIVKSENDIAADYLVKFSRLIRSILENSSKESITVSEEINILTYYLEMEKLRFEDSFEYQIKYEGTTNPEKLLIPNMIIQPFVENALVHGIKHLKTKGNISILISQKEDGLTAIIQDNGVGRAYSRKKNEEEHLIKKSSLGMKITQERLSLNKQFNNKIQIEDLYDEEGKPAGTKITIEFIS